MNFLDKGVCFLSCGWRNNQSTIWGRAAIAVIRFSACAGAGPDPPHGYSDSSDMLKVILQMVQNQDRVVKDLYTHLR